MSDTSQTSAARPAFATERAAPWLIDESDAPHWTRRATDVLYAERYAGALFRAFLAVLAVRLRRPTARVSPADLCWRTSDGRLEHLRCEPYLVPSELEPRRPFLVRVVVNKAPSKRSSWWPTSTGSSRTTPSLTLRSGRSSSSSCPASCSASARTSSSSFGPSRPTATTVRESSSSRPLRPRSLRNTTACGRRAPCTSGANAQGRSSKRGRGRTRASPPRSLLRL